jgi:Zinc knuckle
MAGDVKNVSGRNFKNVNQDYIRHAVSSRSRFLFISGPSFVAVARQVPASRVTVREGGYVVPQGSVRRCGDAGHVAAECRNVLTCFKCGRLGHISSVCCSITLLPSSSSPSHLSSSFSTILRPSTVLILSSLSNQSLRSDMTSYSKVLCFLENDLSEKDRSTEVILEARGVTHDDLLAALKVCFRCGLLFDC